MSRMGLIEEQVYTFGNAANHFNNPDWSSPTSSPSSVVKKKTDSRSPAIMNKVIKHIEHYANGGDYVAQFGVLNYTRVPNRFIGRLYLSPHSGHLLNQHYLHYMFPLDENRHRVAEYSEFMELPVRLNRHDLGREDAAAGLGGGNGDSVAFIGDVNKSVAPLVRLTGSARGERLKVKDFSRLWQYRNGGSPADDVE